MSLLGQHLDQTLAGEGSQVTEEMVKLLPVPNELEIYGYHVSEIYLIHPGRNQQDGGKIGAKDRINEYTHTIIYTFRGERMLEEISNINTKQVNDQQGNKTYRPRISKL